MHCWCRRFALLQGVGAEGASQEAGIGLFPAAAALNHSCRPNCHTVTMGAPRRPPRQQPGHAVQCRMQAGWLATASLLIEAPARARVPGRLTAPLVCCSSCACAAPPLQA